MNQHGPWRCLTTGGEVEQGLAYFDGATPQPQVLGYQYLRVMLAAALGFCALAPPGPPPAADRPRYVCVGLGTGGHAGVGGAVGGGVGRGESGGIGAGGWCAVRTWVGPGGPCGGGPVAAM